MFNLKQGCRARHLKVRAMPFPYRDPMAGGHTNHRNIAGRQPRRLAARPRARRRGADPVARAAEGADPSGGALDPRGHGGARSGDQGRWPASTSRWPSPSRRRRITRRRISRSRSSSRTSICWWSTSRPGMVVHPAAGNFDGTLVNALLHHCGGRLSGIGGVARPGIVHRIDKDTSGLLVVAKTDVAHEGLASAVRQAQHRPALSGDRRRACRCRPTGTIDAPLARSPANRKKIAIVEGRPRQAGGDPLANRLQPLRDAALVECRLETGRTHQVRVHMASIGHPLLGDPVYGRTGKAHREIVEKTGFSPPGAARGRSSASSIRSRKDVCPLKAPFRPTFRNCSSALGV